MEGLRAVLRGDTPLYGLLRYHVGLEGEDGRPEDKTGKMVRPSIVLFLAEEFGARPEEALSAAVALELIHNFSLIHDDIQDRDAVRRGRPAVWSLVGSAQAINAGDLMHAIAEGTVLRAGIQAAKCLATATEAMIEGQAMDLAFETQFVTLDEYLQMIDSKTGALMRCAFELGGIVAAVEPSVRERLVALGAAIGRAFQIQDDLLGTWGDGATLGKPQGSDIRRRKKSYPMMFAFSQAEAEERERVAAIYASDAVSDADVDWIIDWMENLGARRAGMQMVNDHLELARDCVDDLDVSSPGKEQLYVLIDYLEGRER